MSNHVMFFFQTQIYHVRKNVSFMENGSDNLLQKWYPPSQINRQGFTNPRVEATNKAKYTVRVAI